METPPSVQEAQSVLETCTSGTPSSVQTKPPLSHYGTRPLSQSPQSRTSVKIRPSYHTNDGGNTVRIGPRPLSNIGVAKHLNDLRKRAEKAEKEVCVLKKELYNMKKIKKNKKTLKRVYNLRKRVR